jgi:hypothetical protein
VTVPWKFLRAPDERGHILKDAKLFSHVKSLDPAHATSHNIFAVLDIIYKGQESDKHVLHFAVDNDTLSTISHADNPDAHIIEVPDPSSTPPMSLESALEFPDPQPGLPSSSMSPPKKMRGKPKKASPASEAAENDFSAPLPSARSSLHSALPILTSNTLSSVSESIAVAADTQGASSPIRSPSDSASTTVSVSESITPAADTQGASSPIRSPSDSASTTVAQASESHATIDTTAEPKKRGRKRKVVDVTVATVTSADGNITSTATGGPPPAKKPRAKKAEPPGPSRVSERCVRLFLHYSQPGPYSFLGFTRILIRIPLSAFAAVSSSESQVICLSVSTFVLNY